MPTRKNIKTKIVTVTAAGAERQVANAQCLVETLKHERDLVLDVSRLEARRDAATEELRSLREQIRLEREALSLDAEHERQGLDALQIEVRQQLDSERQAGLEELRKAQAQLDTRRTEIEALERSYDAKERSLSEATKENERLFRETSQKNEEAAKLLREAKERHSTTINDQERVTADSKRSVAIKKELEEYRLRLKAVNDQVSDRDAAMAALEREFAGKSKQIDKTLDEAKARDKEAKSRLQSATAQMEQAIAADAQVRDELARLGSAKDQLAQQRNDLDRQRREMDGRERRNLQMEADVRAERERVELAKEDVRRMMMVIREAESHAKR